MDLYNMLLAQKLSGGGGGDATFIAVLENSITDLTIPNGTTKLCRNSLEYRTKLLSVTIPSSVQEIEQRAFQNCTSLKSVTMLAKDPPTAGGNIFNSTSTDLAIYVPADSVEAYKAAANWSPYASKIQAIPE